MSELSNPIPERAPPRRKTFLEMIEKTKDSTRRDRSGHSFSMGSPEHSRGFSFITAVGEKTDDAVFEQAMPFALLKKYSEKCNEWFGFGWHKDSNNDANTVCEVRGQNALRSAPFHPATSAAAGCLVSRWRPASAVPPNFPRAESAPDNSLPACRVGTGLRRPWSARKPAPCSDRLPAGSCCGCCWSKPRKPPCAWIRSSQRVFASLPSKAESGGQGGGGAQVGRATLLDAAYPPKVSRSRSHREPPEGAPGR